METLTEGGAILTILQITHGGVHGLLCGIRRGATPFHAGAFIW